MKIGVFDSGYGGLTILEKIRCILPEYDYVYLGDNARTPYGTRSFDVVYQYTLECVKQLFALDCELVILACNTASAKALRTIQQQDLPIIREQLSKPELRVLGVIRPTVESIKNITTNKKVGVLATYGTIQSESYPIEIHKISPEIEVIGQACPMWVPLIENNEHLSEGADFFVKKYIDELFNKQPDIDTLILGCTHYPLMLNKIRQYVDKNINIIVQGDIVADSLKDYLQRHPEIDCLCSKNRSIQFYTTENPDKFRSSAFTFLQIPIDVKHISI